MSTDGFPWSRDIKTRTLLLSDDFVKKLTLTITHISDTPIH